MKTKLIEKLIERLVDDEGAGVQTCEEGPFKIGSAYLVRTVTYHQVGVLKDIQGS